MPLVLTLLSVKGITVTYTRYRERSSIYAHILERETRTYGHIALAATNIAI